MTAIEEKETALRILELNPHLVEGEANMYGITPQEVIEKRRKSIEDMKKK
jgi:hypothetical protein